MKRNRFLTRTIFFLITLFLITFGTNYTFGVNIITGSNAQNVVHPRKVYVIWYYAANETKRGDAAQFFGIHWQFLWDTDYITPSTVGAHLQHVVEYFHREVGKTFEFYKSGNDIHIEYIQSNRFYVNYEDTTNAPTDHFLDTDPDFWNEAWQDIENNINSNQTLQPFDDLQNIYLVLVQSNYGYIHHDSPYGARGIARMNGGKAMVALGGFKEALKEEDIGWADEDVKSIIAHELGHIFGLLHDFDTDGIMSYDYEKGGGGGGGIFNSVPLLGDTHLSARSENWLSVHPDFSGNPPTTRPPDNPLEIKVSRQSFTPNNSGLPPNNEIMLIPDTSTGTPQYKIFVQMDDIDGLHQVELIAPMLSDVCCNGGGAEYDPTGKVKNYSLATYLTSNGAVNMTVDIDITQWVEESLKRREDSFDLRFTAIDKQGNISYMDTDKQGNLYYTHAYTVVFDRPMLEVSHPKTSVWVTEGTLNGATVLLELKLTEASYVTDISKIRNALTIDGIEGVTINPGNVERINDNEIKVTLDFDHSDFDANTNLTFSVAADAIAGYIGGELTAKLYVLAHEEELHATTQPKVLTEETLDGSEVLLILNDAVTYEDDLIAIQNAVTLSGIAGVSVNKIERTLGSSRSITVVLDFDGTELDTDKVLTFSVDAAAIKNYKGDPLTVEVPVTARIEGGLLKIYWIGEGKIRRANHDGTNIEVLADGRKTGWNRPSNIALDVEGGKMYWSVYVYWNSTCKLLRANLDGSNEEDLVTGIRTVRDLALRDLALDVEGGKIYWMTESMIQRANLDGSDVEDLVPFNIFDLRDIALDVEGGKLYCVNYSGKKILRANLDGSNREVLVTGLYMVYIALDVERGKMYWTAYGSGGSTIQVKILRANLDGSNREEIVPPIEGVGTAGVGTFKFALDVEGGKIYWTDFVDNYPYTDNLLRANLDGSNREVLVTGLRAVMGFALDVERGKMYWAEDGYASTGKIRRANLDGSNVEDLVTGLRIDPITAIAIALLPPVNPAKEAHSVNADVNGDGKVNIQDLIAIAAAFGEVGENDADVNGDGVVNIQDLAAAAAAFGEVAAAPAALSQQGAAHITREEVQHWLTQAQQANLTDPISQRGILFLEQLLAALTPTETALLANYPNPFNPETWIPYQLAKPVDVTLTIYDTQGRVVRALDLGHQPVGIYQGKSRAAHWDGKNTQGESVASGVYYYTLKADDFSATRKMLILK